MFLCIVSLMLKFLRVFHVLVSFVLFLDTTSTIYTSCSCDMSPLIPPTVDMFLHELYYL